jgi:hypothetical protein
MPVSVSFGWTLYVAITPPFAPLVPVGARIARPRGHAGGARWRD